MKNYFMILLTAGILGSVTSALSDGSSLGKYVKYISALVCTILVISPLSSVLKKVSVSVERPSEAVISEDSLTNAAISITEKQLTEKISEKFGITPTGIRIEIDRDGKISLSLSLTEEDEEHRERIEEYLDSLCR